MKTIHFHIDSIIYKNRITYVLAFLQKHPLSPSHISLKINTKGVSNIQDKRNLFIFYRKKNSEVSSAYFIPAQELIFNKKIVKSSNLTANLYHHKQHQLYSVENKKQKPQAFLKNRKFGFDLLESIFFHLSRYEEFHASPEDWDEYDMLEESKHFLVRYQLYQRPVLDHLVYSFFEALDLKPQKKTTIFQLSHDIDSIWKLPSFHRLARAGARLMLDKKPLLIGKLIQQYWKIKTKRKKDPFDVFDWFLIENRSIKKVIYFMSGGKTRYENFYNIHHPYVKEIIEKAKNLGYEIGLHPSYLTWKNQAMLEEELATLESVVGHRISHSRQHFLHCSFPQTFDNLTATNLSYDSTLGYQNLIGFRCGTGFDFYLYNLKKDCPYSIKESPMIVMDCALLAMSHQNVPKARVLLDNFLNQNKHYTQITFNFHNHVFDGWRWNEKEMKLLYYRLFRGNLDC